MMLTLSWNVTHNINSSEVFSYIMSSGKIGLANMEEVCFLLVEICLHVRKYITIVRHIYIVVNNRSLIIIIIIILL